MSKFLDETGVARMWSNIKRYVAKNSGSSTGGVPSACILIWSGSADNVPSGWSLCDGQNGTPDLRGRFVLGRSDSHAIGETGGFEEVTLTEEQMPKHYHPTGQSMSETPGIYQNVVVKGDSNHRYYDGSTNNAGGSQPHPNMPPYYTLAYIMKL